MREDDKTFIASAMKNVNEAKLSAEDRQLKAWRGIVVIVWLMFLLAVAGHFCSCGGGHLVGYSPKCVTQAGVTLAESPYQISCEKLAPYESRLIDLYSVFGYRKGMLKDWVMTAEKEIDDKGSIGEGAYNGQASQKYAGLTWASYKLIQIGEIGLKGPRQTGYAHEMMHAFCDELGLPSHGIITNDGPLPDDPWGVPSDPDSKWHKINEAQACLDPFCDTDPSFP